MTITPSTGEVDRREKGEKRIKFDIREGFVAAEEEDGVWKLYFDLNKGGLKGVKAGNSGRGNAEVDVVRVLAEDEKKDLGA